MSAALSVTPSARGPLHIALWLVQGLLAFTFLGAGMMKLTQPMDALLANGMTFVATTPEAVVRFIGLSELLGAVGLVLPSALRIAPRLTGAAAVGLLVVMVLAAGTHLMNGEASHVPVNVVLGGLSAFVAWGRLSAARIAPRR